MATITSLLDDVRPTVASSIPVETLIWAIRLCAREFCERSRWLRETSTYDIVAGQRYYTLTPTMAQTEIIGAKAVEIGDEPLTPSSFEEHRQMDGYSTSWVWEPPAEVWPTPTPTRDITDGLAVRLILKPTATATELPDYLLRNNRETITQGAMEHVLRMKKSAWYDPDEANRLRAEFDRRVFAARSAADRSHRPRAFRTIPAWRPR